MLFSCIMMPLSGRGLDRVKKRVCVWLGQGMEEGESGHRSSDK